MSITSAPQPPPHALRPRAGGVKSAIDARRRHSGRRDIVRAARYWPAVFLAALLIAVLALPSGAAARIQLIAAAALLACIGALMRHQNRERSSAPRRRRRRRSDLPPAPAEG